MTFLDLPAGDPVFVDANTLVFHFEPHPQWGTACSQLLNQIEQGVTVGYTSTHVLGEMAHRLMTIEARSLHGWSRGKVTARIRQHKGIIQTLALFRTAIESILQSQIKVLSIPPMLMAQAAPISQQYDLLTNDALIVALMQSHGLTNLASQDADFDCVPGLTRYAPA